MDSTAFNLAKYLQANGVVSDGEFSVGESLTELVTHVIVSDGPSLASESKAQFFNRAIQLYFVGSSTTSYNDLFKWANSIYEYVLRIPHGASLNGQLCSGFTVRTTLSPIMKDELNRFAFSANLNTTVRGLR